VNEKTTLLVMMETPVPKGNTASPENAQQKASQPWIAMMETPVQVTCAMEKVAALTSMLKEAAMMETPAPPKTFVTRVFA